VLKYQGDKRRPFFKPTKAKKVMVDGVLKLFVRGYNLPVRDFQKKYYYPTQKKNGALILWEPKDGLLTPVTPKMVKGASREDMNELKNRYTVYKEQLEACGVQGVDFEFDEELYNTLIMNAVDDTDIDFMLQEIARVDSQYTSGWRDFLAKYGSHMVLVIIAICLLTGFIVYLDKGPGFAAQCASMAQEASKNVFERYATTLPSPPA
jgi:hypothetical protein